MGFAPLRLIRIGFFVIAPDVALPILFILTWRSPTLLGETAVLECMATILLEFVLIHSTGFFLGSTMKDGKFQWKTIGGLLALYTLFAIPTAILAGASWPIAILYARSIGTIWSAADSTGEGRKGLELRLAPAAVCYLLTVFLMIFLPVPKWGITDRVASEVRDTMDEKGFETGGDIASTEPHRIIAWGAMYFSGVLAWEIFLISPSGRRMRMNYQPQMK